MREWLQGWEGNEPPRMPLAVIGSGPHGATFLSTYRMYESNHSPLVVDQREHIGGQFADAEEPVFRLNSRNRPQMEGVDREERNLPGGQQTINPLGTMATLQVSDLSGEAYVTQDVLAYATRFNTITSAKDFLTECRLIATKHVRREDGSEVERCTFLDEEESKTYTVDFDELVIAGGIGKDVFNLKGADEVTQRFTERQKEKLNNGERPTVMSFPQMIEWFGNPANKSPLKGVKEVVVSGSGDSANVAVGLLLGYEPGADRMPVSMDRVEKVYWVGQDIPSKEEWLKNIRTRYAQVGLEFPRERVESYYSRIVPLAGKVNDVDAGFNDAEEKVNVFREGESRLQADLYIACNGFRNDLPGVLASNTLVERKVFDLFSGRFDNAADKFVPGMVFERRNSTLEVQVLGTNGNSIEYLIRQDGESRAKTVEVNEFTEFINDRFSPQDTLFVPEKGTSYEELFDESGFAVGKRVKGTNVTLVGPVSQLSISEKERRSAPVLEQIPENTAALFRYGRGTENVARMVAKRLSGVPAQRYDSVPEKKSMVLQKGGDRVGTGPVGKFVNLQRNPKEVPYHVPHMEALKTALADHLSQLQFPSNLSEVRLSISMEPYKESGQRFAYSLDGLQVTNSEGRESDNKIRDWLEEIAKDDIFATAVTHEAKDHIKKTIGKDKLRISEVKRKVDELEALTGGGLPTIEAENTRRINLELTIPVRGSRAEAMQLKHEWVDVL
jgi:hypothetical protein